MANNIKIIAFIAAILFCSPQPGLGDSQNSKTANNSTANTQQNATENDSGERYLYFCGGRFRRSKGFIRSPRFPWRYPDNSYCIYQILTRRYRRIFLKFTHFSLANPKPYCTDSLRIYNGRSAYSGSLMAKYCGGDQSYALNRTLVSTTNIVTMYFVTKNDGYRGRGFRLFYKTGRPPAATTSAPATTTILPSTETTSMPTTTTAQSTTVITTQLPTQGPTQQPTQEPTQETTQESTQEPTQEPTTTPNATLPATTTSTLSTDTSSEQTQLPTLQPNVTTATIPANSTDRCGIPAIPGNLLSRIVGGSEAKKHSIPWQVMVSRGSSLCGGALLNPFWVVTAAHCLPSSSANANLVTVRLGKHKLITESNEEKIVAAAIYNHPQYSTASKDIGLIKLSRAATLSDRVSPICLPKSTDLYPPNENCVVSGWGSMSFGGILPTTLRKVVVPLVSNPICNRPESYNGGVASHMLCAGFGNGGKDACQGDSGGPLFCKTLNGAPNQWSLVGIVSWGDGCAKPNKYGVYTRVTEFVDWIGRTMANN